MSAAMDAGSRFPSQVTALRRLLLAHGYPPVPVTAPKDGDRSAGKKPVMRDWRTGCLAADEAEVRRWETDQPQCTNTGIACGPIVALDIDVPVPELAARIEAAAVAMLGATPLRRVGNAPKTLLCYRPAVPMGKAETPELFLPDGTKVQVEVLGAGQQFVAFGTHPGTRCEYEWPASGPDVVPASELPTVTGEALRDFLGAAEAMLRRAGGRTEKERAAENAGRHCQLNQRTPTPAQFSRDLVSVVETKLRSHGRSHAECC